MIKAFISHSSAQKPFVKDLVEELGRDKCIIDCFNFNPAFKTIDEIYKNIELSTVFVLLLSKESLDSKWVKKEVRFAMEKLQPSELDRFWPYIIDDDLEIEDCPEWMRRDKCFNLKKFRSYKMLAHDINQKFRQIIWSKNPKRKQLETLMVGRNREVDKFEDIYLSDRGMNLKAFVISGRDGVGKDMFISKCLNKIGYDAEVIPYSIDLGVKEGVEDFIIQLNLITQTYKENQLIDVLKNSPMEKADVAARLANKLLDNNGVVTINDDMSCVLPNKKIADWLTVIVEDSGLCNKLALFIKSRVRLESYAEKEHPSFGHLSLEPLTTNERKKLFYSLMRQYEITDLSEENVDFFVNKLLLSPSQLAKAAEEISKESLVKAKRDIDSLITWGDKKIKPMLSHFFNDEECKQLLIILSKIDPLSYDILEKFFGERIEEVMAKVDKLMDYGIVTIFGPHEEFFRLDHYLCDYIKRNHINLPSDLDSLLHEILEQKIALSAEITEDISAYLYEKKKLIVSGKGKTNDFLIPSVVIASVMELYNRQDYAQVINICDMILNDCHNYFPDQERELRYWLCLALARRTDKRFYEEVVHFRGIDYDFLRGFYHRNAMEYPQAERFLGKAIDKSPNMQRAKREMVTVLLAQKKYSEALEMAKENYENNPENSYQIHGYFRCLVRKSPLERNDQKTLEVLMEAMDENPSDKREELYAAMNIEYQDYILHKKPCEILDMITEAEQEFPNSINIKRVSLAYKLKQKIIFKEETLPEDY